MRTYADVLPQGNTGLAEEAFKRAFARASGKSQEAAQVVKSVA